jgi:hypothetical protein
MHRTRYRDPAARFSLFTPISAETFALDVLERRRYDLAVRQEAGKPLEVPRRLAA